MTGSGAPNPNVDFVRETLPSVADRLAAIEARQSQGVDQSAIDAAIATHDAAADPHPGYETAAETAALIATHAAAADPHPVYLTQAEADALYTALGAGAGMANPMIAAGDLIYMGGGADLARAYSAIIGDGGQNGTAVNLYDGDDSSSFTSNAEAVANIATGVDLGSAQSMAAFRLVLYGTSGFASVPVGGTLLIESSPDNATWTVETTYVVTGADSGILATSGTARFWRVRCPANTGTRLGLRTFSLFDAAVPARLPKGTLGQTLKQGVNGPEWSA